MTPHQIQLKIENKHFVNKNIVNYENVKKKYSYWIYRGFK